MGSLSNKIGSEILLFDGSMGALIGQMGYHTTCPDEMALTHPDVIKSIHKAYFDAGANVLLADTFGATDMALAHKGKEGMSEAITEAAVALAKEVAGENGLVAVDMGPTSEFMYPAGAFHTQDFYETFFRQAAAAKRAKADFAMIETQTDAAEARAACLAARDAGLDSVMSFTFSGARTLMGSSAECCALIAKAAGASAIGINCSTGPDQMLPVLKAMRSVCDLPVIVQPNAGLPQTKSDGSVFYPFTPEEMLESMRAIVQGGAGAIGGCCGTTPDHIRLLKTLAGGPAPAPANDKNAYVCSLRTFALLSDALEAMEEIEDSEDLYDVEDPSALVLIDLCGMSPEEAQAKAEECAAMSKNPLAFKADSEEALEKALFVYPGVAAVKADKALDGVIRKYGAIRI